ncbi:MAG TPA: hypothetical protein VFF69_06150 [Phycisphaerales bacterium]|nr:hypothetical protein [Phycisphaerales bacterium]
MTTRVPSVAALCLAAGSVAAQPTAFTYQGSLRDGGGPADGSYDFRFGLYDAETGGLQHGADVYVDDAGVAGGQFTALVDFGLQFPGSERYLQVAVRPGGVDNANRHPSTYTVLDPRQRLTSSPHAVRALDADRFDGFESTHFFSEHSANFEANPGWGSYTLFARSTAGGTGIISASSDEAVSYFLGAGVSAFSDSGVAVGALNQRGGVGVYAVGDYAGVAPGRGVYAAASHPDSVAIEAFHGGQGSHGTMAGYVEASDLYPSSVGVSAGLYSVGVYGVWARSNGLASAIVGESPEWYGLFGGTRDGPAGVFGTSGGAGAGIRAHHSSATGTALEIAQGEIRVASAGINTPTAAFIHDAAGSNTSGHVTYINHPMLNGDPFAIMMVTQNWNPPGQGGVYNAHPLGVWYTGSRWAIFNQDFASMPIGASFNIMVIKTSSGGAPAHEPTPGGEGAARRSITPLPPVPTPELVKPTHTGKAE